MRRITIALTLMICLAGLAGASYAQDEAPPPEDPQARVEAMKRIEMYRIFKLTEVLELENEDAARIFPIIQRYDSQFRQISEKKEKLLQEMHLELKKETPDQKRLKKLVDDVLGIEREFIKVRAAQFEELKKELNGEQYARFLIFDQHFREEINRMINDIHRKRKRRGRRIRQQQPQ